MTALTIIGSFILASVFIVSGSLKMVNREKTRQTLINFSVPKNIASYLSTLLPITEVIVGLLLLSPFAAYGAIASVILLVFFAAARLASPSSV